MATKLTAGGNVSLPTDVLSVTVRTGKTADVASFRTYEDGKTRSDLDFVFYGQTSNDDSSICLTASDLSTSFEVDLLRLKSDVKKIAFTITADMGDLSSLAPVCIEVAQGAEVLVRADVAMSDRNEAALILGELYRRNDEWKFRFVSQGFNGGLKPLAEHFGVDISDDSSAPEPAPEPVSNPAPTPTPTPTALPPESKPLSLNKISLSRANPTISLQKKSTTYGLMKVNLNWNRKKPQAGLISGLFGGHKPITLDLGAFVKLRDGMGVVQALGGNYGSVQDPPYLQLQGEDRTGPVTDGEWLHINGDKWAEIEEILLFTFIYKGVPDWAEAKGVVSIQLPNQPAVETLLNEGSMGKTTCAIARLINQEGQFKIERVNRYFSGLTAMDEALGWGFSWESGSKE
ncbi:MAG: tellurite resistance protein TerA [Motiliproteus sp.]|jgi:tellurite resistance protein TerA